MIFLNVRLFRRCISLLLLISAASVFAASKTRILAPSDEMSKIARIASNRLINDHYSQQRMDESISSILFDDYFNLLDPMHILFTKEDIRKFEGQRKLLGNQIRRGNVQFAFDVFNLFLKKLDTYEKFTEKYLQTAPPLNTNETYEYNRTKSIRASNQAELETIWKKKIRNDLILLELMDRSKKMEQDKKTTVKKSLTRVFSKKTKEQTPVQRTSKRISRYLRYYREMEAQDVLELYLTCLTQVYDPHSQYMSPRTEEDFNINMKLSLGGIGAVLTNEDGYTKVVRIIPDGPAAKDKRLKEDDRIIAVTQEKGKPVNIVNMPLNKAVSLIRGEENTKVTLTVLEAAKGSSATPVNITLVRAVVSLKDSEASGKVHEISTLSGKKRIGVIILPSFYMDFAAAYRGVEDFKSATRDVANLIRKLSKEKPLDGLVIDLRSNGGGSLMEAVALTGLFIPEGPVVQIRDQRSCKVNADHDGGRVLYAGPLAVLTNRFSASASEIFAGAIKDYKRGIILGEMQTHGKGTVQTIIELNPYAFYLGSRTPSGCMRLTNAKYYRINGASTQIKGVTPDIIFPSFSDVMEVGEDKLPHALKWDTIEPVQYKVIHPELKSIISILKKRSGKRIATEKEFQILKRDIESFRKIRERKTVVLNLEQRWREYLADKKIHEEQEKLLHLDQDNLKKKDAKVKDLFLDETLRVMGDWLDISCKFQKNK